MFRFGSAHVCKDNGFDVEGWEEYAEDWRFFFDCMLLPVLKQVCAKLRGILQNVFNVLCKK